ncbi:MAG: hypothetical protein ABEK16_02780 [Candidatus Nanohalobium sp.]
MSKVVFDRLIDGERQNKDGYYLKDARFFTGSGDSHRSLLLDTGASWTTVSKVVAKELGIDFRSEENPELRNQWHSHGSRAPYSFLHNTWKKHSKKSIRVTSTLANGEDIQSYLHPVGLQMENGFEFTSIVNIIPREVDTPLFGVQPIMRYAESFELKAGGERIVAQFEESNMFDTVLSKYK